MVSPAAWEKSLGKTLGRQGSRVGTDEAALIARKSLFSTCGGFLYQHFGIAERPSYRGRKDKQVFENRHLFIYLI